MPILHKHKDSNSYYVLTSIKGKVVSFQLTAEGYAHLQEAGIIPGKPFNRFLLLDLYRDGHAFTGHTKTKHLPKQGELDFTDDPEPETMFPSCSSCSSQEDLHFVEVVGHKRSATILCKACRAKELSHIDASMPLPFVTRSVLKRLFEMKEINDIDKSVSSYRDLLNMEFSEKWKALAQSKKRKHVQEMLIDNTPSDRLV